MSFGNLIDLGTKPSQNLNVNGITCNEVVSTFITCDELTTGSIDISTINTNIVDTETLRVNTIAPKIGVNVEFDANLRLNFLPTQNNNGSQVLIRDFNSGIIEERFFPILSSVTARISNDNLLTTSSEIFAPYLTLNYNPTVSGYYSFNFKVELGTSAVNRTAYVVFRFPLQLPPLPTVITDNEFAKPQDVIAEDWNSITDTNVTFLTAGVPYTFTILYRAGPSSTARIRRGVIYLTYFST